MRASVMEKSGQAGMQRALSLFKRTLDHLPDGILLIGADRKVIYANKAFMRIWKIPTALMAKRDDAKLLQYVTGQVEDPEGFLLEVERLYGTQHSSEDQLRFRDGRVIARRSAPFREEGDGLARIWIFTDVTEAWQAQMDQLTGLPNRRAYARLFPKIATAGDDGLLKAVALMDIDNFKKYNDLYGHAAGDAVLRRIGMLLSSRLSRDDTAFRVGGEEFLIACRSRNERGAMDFIEDLRAAIEDEGIEHRGNRPGKVLTASFGLAVFRGGREPGALFDAVDEALYRSKAAGRNQVTLADLSGQAIRSVSPAITRRPAQPRLLSA